MSQKLQDDYEALIEGAGLVDFSDRTRIEVRGDDRASFLHNLSTNDVKKLQPGQGCEAFFLDARGHIKGHVFLICRPDSIVIETMAGQSTALIAHLDRYVIREKVEFADRSDAWGAFLLAGEQSTAVLAGLASAALPEAPLANADVEVAGHAVVVIRVAITPAAGYLLLFPRPAQAAVAEAMTTNGVRTCDGTAFEAARIEARFPLYDVDMTAKNLPQEVARDTMAISFKKGCYLGQETVARIDALGHVNKRLVGLKFDDLQAVAPGTELISGDQVVGQVTSSAFVPRFRASLALAYLRRGYDAPGSKLASGCGEAVVLEA